jgi:hypothetical protein
VKNLFKDISVRLLEPEAFALHKLFHHLRLTASFAKTTSRISDNFFSSLLSSLSIRGRFIEASALILNPSSYNAEKLRRSFIEANPISREISVEYHLREH